MMTHITLRVLLVSVEFACINFIDVLETLRMKKEVQNSPLLIKSLLLERKLSEHPQIRKIRRILEKNKNHPVNFHFKLEVQRPARNLWLGRDSRILRKL